MFLWGSCKPFLQDNLNWEEKLNWSGEREGYRSRERKRWRIENRSRKKGTDLKRDAADLKRERAATDWRERAGCVIFKNQNKNYGRRWSFALLFFFFGKVILKKSDCVWWVRTIWNVKKLWCVKLLLEGVKDRYYTGSLLNVFSFI